MIASSRILVAGDSVYFIRKKTIFFLLNLSRTVAISDTMELFCTPVSSRNSRIAAVSNDSHFFTRHLGSMWLPSLWSTQRISLFHFLSRIYIPPAQSSSQKYEAIFFFHISSIFCLFLTDFMNCIIGILEKNEKNLHNYLFYLYSRHFRHIARGRSSAG